MIICTVTVTHCSQISDNTLLYVHVHLTDEQTVLYFWYHWKFLVVRLTLCTSNLILHHQRIDNNCYETERAKESTKNCQAKWPAENIGVPVGHPGTIKSDHHSKDGNRRTNAHGCNTSDTPVEHKAISTNYRSVKCRTKLKTSKHIKIHCIGAYCLCGALS